MNFRPAVHKSLEEVHETVSTRKKGWRRIFAFLGPAYLVAVGYMDPGNWATDIEGGSRYGYALLWILVMSNLMAILLQYLCARLGIVYRRDLAQVNRELYPAPINFCLYLFAEIAIAATDLAEIIGMAIGLNLLFGLPLIWGVSITVLDTFLILYLQKLGMRKMEAFIVALIAIIITCFVVQLIMVKPQSAQIMAGLKPSLPDEHALYIAIGILGATVMPHNLYLHSALVQSRKIEPGIEAKKKALKYNFIDSTIALNLALVVNASILILAASTFHHKGFQDVSSIETAHQMLAPLVGSAWAPILFAIALIAAGQSSTVTGTLAGQIVMEGYLNIHIQPWLRRLITRLIAVIPAFITIIAAGPEKMADLLILSQVILSIQLSFAIIPLLHAVTNKRIMGVFVIKPWMLFLSLLAVGIIIYLNLRLIVELLISYWHFLADSLWGKLLIYFGITIFAGILVLTILWPIVSKKHTAEQQ